MDSVASDDGEPLVNGGAVIVKRQQSACFRFLVVVLLSAVVVGVTIGVAVGVARNELPSDPRERALALMARFPLIDTHNDLPWVYRTLVKNAVFSGGLDIGVSTGNTTMTDIPRLKQGRVGGQMWSVFVACSYNDKDAVRATQEQVDVVLQMAQRYPSFFHLASTASQARAAFADGFFPSLMGIEGGHQIDSSLASLRAFRSSGVRYMTLTHNCSTPWSVSCCPDNSPPSGNVTGLSAFGREVVREMNRIGMMVDLSHTAIQTMRDALDVTIAPVIFSHSNARAICETPRNVPDEILLRLKQNGGVVCITFVPGFVNCSAPASQTSIAQGAERIDVIFHFFFFLFFFFSVADHFDYIRNLIGSEHLGIGADFDGIAETIPGLGDVSKYPDLIAELIRRKYSDSEIEGILGGNVLRILQSAEDVSAQLSQKNTIPGQAVMSSVPGDVCRTNY